MVQSGYKVSDSNLSWIPKNEVELEDKSKAVQVLGFLEKLEELDDVQGVASTLHVTDEVAEAFEAEQ